MTDDLVKRLRVWTMNTEDVGLRLLAADRIELLEGALIAIIITAPFGEPQEIARAALGEKKDD